MATRRRQLRQQFGPEYDRAVSEQDSRIRAEAELTGRQRRVRKLDIRPLSGAARARYLAQWQTIQEQFVDSPDSAVTAAYTLVTTVMRELGYPVTDDEQVAADLSVEHARTVDHFRSAQAITREVAHGSVSTEDLRQALIHYRELFADLLGEPGDVVRPRVAAGRHAAASDVAPADGAAPADYATADDQIPDGGTYPASTEPDGMPAGTSPATEPYGSPRQ
jgi:hypothetical protein